MNNPFRSLPEQISTLLNARTPRKLDLKHSGRAAILMPIFKQDQEYFFLLTKRTQRVETHKGQISFPGGVKDVSDRDLLQTALRESWEEIGLAPERVQILGEFDEYFSVTDLLVTPYAGWLDSQYDLRLNPDEVEEVFHVPFSVFRDSRLCRVETRRRLEVERKIYFYNYEGKEVWGLTAQIIRDFLKLIDPPAPRSN